MADSVGGSTFPKTGIQEGHLHFDKTANTLYIYNGGNPADIANWSEVGGAGDAVSSGNQRWFWKFSGTEFSVGFGATGEQDFVAPANGAIVQWGVISINAGQDMDFSLRYDPFNIDELIDSVVITTAQTEALFERVVSKVVLLGDVIAVYQTNVFNPAEHGAVMCGYIDFVPS